MKRMDDQIMGFVAFPLVNIPLWIILGISQRIDSLERLCRGLSMASCLPWLFSSALSLASDISPSLASQ